MKQISQFLGTSALFNIWNLELNNDLNKMSLPFLSECQILVYSTDYMGICF